MRSSGRIVTFSAIARRGGAQAAVILRRVTLVLLTPIGLDADCWERVPLPGIRRVKHTFPGFGGRPRARRAADDGEPRRRGRGELRRPLDVAGMSLGGMVAQHVALRHPDRVRSLMVACTGASADPGTMEERAARRGDGMEGVLEETLERWFTPPALAERPEHPGVAYARGTCSRSSPRAFADGWRAIAGHDVTRGSARSRDPDDRAGRARPTPPRPSSAAG